MSEDVASLAGTEDAPEGVSIDLYAKIDARLAIDKKTPLAEVLAHFSVGEEQWSLARKVWAKRIEDEVRSAASPGLSSSVEARYPLSIRYAATYAEAAKAAQALAAPPALTRGGS